MSIDGDCQWPKFDLISNKQKICTERSINRIQYEKKTQCAETKYWTDASNRKNSSFIHMETRVSERNGKKILFFI